MSSSRKRRIAPPRLHRDWRRILRHSWVVRILGAEAFLEGGRVACDVLAADPPMPRWAFSLIAAGFTASALIARFVAQRKFSQGDDA